MYLHHQAAAHSEWAAGWSWGGWEEVVLVVLVVWGGVGQEP